MKDQVKTSKGRLTREKILETALALFRQRGFEATTMREIARAAGVSLGNAYYYFASKEVLIQGFYDRTHREHLAACRELLATERDLERRLAGVLHAKLETAEPYHRFAGVLFKTAADPRSPLNPFSDQSRAVRDEAIALFDTVIDGASLRVGPRLRRELPRLLWTYMMGIILFWIHDASAGRVRSRRLVDQSAALVVRMIRLASTPVMRPLTGRVLHMLAALREESP